VTPFPEADAASSEAFTIDPVIRERPAEVIDERRLTLIWIHACYRNVTKHFADHFQIPPNAR
jgi:hypothetical protein